MKFKLQVAFLEGGDPWEEPYDKEELTTQAEVEQWAKDTIERFNATLRPKEKPRKLVGVELIGESTPRHQWEKINLVTVRDARGSYDAYQCQRCGITGKRFGLGGEVARDREYRARKYEVCTGGNNGRG